MIILDTNVVSAVMKPNDNPRVVAWLNLQRIGILWTTTITVMEIRYGVLRMAEGRRRSRVTQAFELASVLLSARIVPFDFEAAEQAAQIAAEAHARGHNIDTPDAQIAGIVRSRNATLATRNVRHFSDLGIPLANPWTD